MRKDGDGYRVVARYDGEIEMEGKYMSEMLIYQNESGEIKVDVRFEEKSIGQIKSDD